MCPKLFNYCLGGGASSKFLAFVALVIAWPTVSFAAPSSSAFPSSKYIQILDQESSAIRFALSAGPLRSRGKFTTFGGELSLAKNSLEPLSVELEIDPSKAKLENQAGTAVTLPQRGMMKFVSKAIKKINKQLYRVQGTANWGTEKYSMTLTVSLINQSAKVTTAKFNVGGGIPGLSEFEGLELLGIDAKSRGELSGQLVFRKTE